jgi:hypothetical protein
MKMTIVLDQKGEIVAVQQGPIQDPAGHRGAEGTGGLVAGPGQKLEEREVPDHLVSVDIEKFAKEIRAHLTS